MYVEYKTATTLTPKVDGCPLNSKWNLRDLSMDANLMPSVISCIARSNELSDSNYVE